MTARTTTLKGGDAGAYYVEEELGYYLDRGEPAGRWQGRGVASLQLGDTVDEESFLSLMAGEDPRTGRALGTLAPGLDLRAIVDRARPVVTTT